MLINKAGFAEIQALGSLPDSRQIAIGSSDCLMQAYDSMGDLCSPIMAIPGTSRRWHGSQDRFHCPAIQPCIASSGNDGTMQGWAFRQTANAKPSQTLTAQGEILVYRGHCGPVTFLMWATDGQRMVSGSTGGAAMARNVNENVSSSRYCQTCGVTNPVLAAVCASYQQLFSQHTAGSRTSTSH